MIDVARARADTPGCRDVVHLNNAGAALPTRAVLDTVIEHLELEGARRRVRGRRRGRGAVDARCTTSVAALVGASADEIALVENATRAWTWCAYALGASFAPATASSRRTPSTRAT